MNTTTSKPKTPWWTKWLVPFTAYRDDPKPIPPRAVRRRRVVTISTLMIACLVSVVISPSGAGLAGFALAVLVAGPAYLWFARSATRNMIAASHGPLDEWQRDQVLRAYRTAFVIIQMVVLVLGLVLANRDSTLIREVLHIGAPATLSFSQVAMPLFLIGVVMLPWVPVAVLAWRLPDEEDE